MRNVCLIPTVLICCLFAIGASAQQQSSRSKSSDKLYEKGELKNNILIKNASAINTANLEFSPVYYENGLVYVSYHPKGPKDKKTNTTFFELFYCEISADGMPQGPSEFSARINSQSHEGPVSFSRDGNTIYFSRNNMKKGATKSNSKGKIVNKVYEAKRGAVDWDNFTEMPFNDDEFNTMHPALSSNGRQLFFTSDRPGGYGGYDLYMAEKKGDTWSQPVNLGPQINTDQHEAFPYLHESGTLFFSSKGHNGYGGYDLYMIDMDASEWGTVKNLGVPFNSQRDDLGLAIDDEGIRGYFASNRAGGYGQDDIYFFEADETIINKQPVNLNSRIITFNENTGERIMSASVRVFERAADGFLEGNELYDIQLLPSGESGELVMKLVRKSAEELGDPTMFTNGNGEATHELKTNRNYMIVASKKGYDSGEILYSTVGEYGNQTIRVPLKPKNCASMVGVVTVSKFKTRVPHALVRIINECNGAENVIRSNSKGEFEFCLPLGCEFAIYAEKEGYTRGLSKTSTESSTNTQTVEVNVALSPIAESIIKEPIKEGSVIVLENIYYDFDKSVIRKGAARELDALKELMALYPSMEIELIAHTDARGQKEYNLELSLRRAESARNYLVSKGIPADRMKAFGYGESQLRNECTEGISCTEEEHQYNRRTEVKITKIDEPIKVQYGEGEPIENNRME